LLELGVGSGDRVVAYLPNIPEALVVLYATASIGAIFTAVAPESGSRIVINKVAQLDPKVLVAVDGYRYGGKDFDRADTVAEIRSEIPCIEATIAMDYLHPGEQSIPDALPWSLATAQLDAPLEFAQVPFNHPLYIVFSSGTTGNPKAILHSHGGIVLEHLKLWGLHEDIGRGDRWFWYSSTNWMAWNYCASIPMCGAAIVCFDGHPMRPGLSDYWRTIADEKVTWLGISPGFLLNCLRNGLVPRDAVDLSALRTITCGGSPLTAELFRWVYDAVSPTAYLSSGSGGTDVASSFVAGTRLLPVRAGEIACRLLGVDAAAFGEDGREVTGQRGELVIRRPMPSMPLGFWGDDGSRYREAYFERFPGVWCHGDWVLFTPDGTCRVIGRSDATLNRGGVRLGTSEFYEVIEDMPEIEESLVVHVEDAEGGLGRLILFVTTPDGSELPAGVVGEIRRKLRAELSPRHEPDEIWRVTAIPKTLTGKRQEVQVKRVLLDPGFGEPGDGLDEFRAIAAQLRSKAGVSS
jgi:acetoacetyl-CoA synthetase